jgi:hypothetical protein
LIGGIHIIENRQHRVKCAAHLEVLADDVSPVDESGALEDQVRQPEKIHKEEKDHGQLCAC